MIVAAKKLSQVATHMTLAFGLMYVMTGSLAFGGLAAIIEPVINVALLPLHEGFWRRLRARAGRYATAVLAAEKLSQTGFHMIVAMAVMYWATGSLALGGLAAVLEPILNVVALPYHDRLWERFEARVAGERLAAA
ncbi:DUF2061 domain-containing protein [Massilia sp. YMA4]|uniref:DUF2061 domain-containing protein n=1 Tax=Massilia sp. YMA4 TaxID=1593482 RepID=UPI000DD11BA6|nr:DUF2061 domain-containing protein [Massilia sp. YMA4]AXA92442.1 DUF2061 domain-containing protein [Massilia sp. YMA4]